MASGFSSLWSTTFGLDIFVHIIPLENFRKGLARIKRLTYRALIPIYIIYPLQHSYHQQGKRQFEGDFIDLINLTNKEEIGLQLPISGFI